MINASVPCSDIHSAYTFDHDMIGSNDNCEVHRITNKETGEVLACKSIHINSGTGMYQNEVRIMESLRDHKNIVQFKEVHLDQEELKMHIVMELCEGGDLLDGVIRMGHRYTEKKAADLFREIVSIISTCHSSGVMHGDLKPENLMFFTMEEDSPIKAIDFGLANFLEPGETFKCVPGTFPYYAPETLDGKNGKEADIWSAGIILCVLLTGFPPFMIDDPSDTDSMCIAIEEIRDGFIDYSSVPWTSVSPIAIDLLKEILMVDPRARISAADILRHPWVREGGNNASEEPMDIGIIGRMKRLQAICKFGRLSFKGIAETLSGEEIMDLKECFKSMDTNNLGTLSFKELMKGLNNWGSQLKGIIPQFSFSQVKKFLESDGRINYDEFVGRMLNRN